jgi:ADP-heptose:LPS heptosyltransferase
MGARLHCNSKQRYVGKIADAQQTVVSRAFPNGGRCTSVNFSSYNLGRKMIQRSHVTNLRGKTSIRETAALLHNVRLYVGTSDFLCTQEQ